jgi:hypothetical protein
MPDDTITLVSTTDSAEEVQAALTNRPVVAAVEEAAGEAPAGDEVAEANETPEQTEARENREASQAGGALAKRKTKLQKDIDEQVWRKNALRKDAEAEEARLYELRRQRQELEAAAAPAPVPTPEPAPAAAAAADAPLGRPEPKLDALGADGDAKYATYEDYLSDHAAWSKEEAILAAKQVFAEKEQADRVRIERESTSRVVNDRLATFNTQLEAFKKTHADFDATFAETKEAVQETLVGIGPNALKVIDGFTVFDAQDGPALMYYLLKRPDELKAIALKAPPQQLVHLARIDERLKPAGAKRNGPSAASVDTRAPEPIRPVGSGPTATSVPLDEESYQDYKLRRSRELRGRTG